MLPVNTSEVAAAVMKQQTAIAIPEEWILLLSGVLRRDTRLGGRDSLSWPQEDGLRWLHLRGGGVSF
jgi:hypothetical protein